MSIMRVFRKYNRHMLAVFVVGLMIAFIMPQTLQRFGEPDPSKQPIGSVFDNEPIARGDLRAAQSALDVMRTLVRAMPVPKQASEMLDYQVLRGLAGGSPLNYLLLVRESQRMGLEVSSDGVDRKLAAWQVPAEAVNFVLEQYRMSLRTFRSIVADAIRVREAFALVAPGTIISEPELRALFTLTNARMTTAILPVSAEDFVAEIENPTDEQLATHFGRNKETFRFANRIAVEYLEVDVDAIEKQVRVRRKRAREYWLQHQNEFTETTTQPTTTASATQPTTETVTRQLSFEEALPRVVAKLKKAAARTKAREAIYGARDRALSFWQGAKRNEKTGLKIRPESVADYKALAAQISRQKGVPVRYHRSQLVDQAGATALKGIGQAFLMTARPVRFADYAFRIVPLVAPPEQTDGSVRPVLVKEQDSVLHADWSGQPVSQYLFRVVQIEPSRLPHSLDEVKSEAVRDVKMSQAYERALKLASQIKALAGKAKLIDLAKSKDKDIAALFGKLTVDEPATETFARRMGWGTRIMDPFIPSVKMPRGRFADRCFDVLWAQPSTQPDGTFTCTIIEDTAGRTAYLVQLLEKQPVERRKYEQGRPFLLGSALRDRQIGFIGNWFNPQNIRQRTRYHETERD